MLKKAFMVASMLVLAAVSAGCATRHLELPVHTATVIEAQQSLRQEFQPSAGGAAAGALVGGAAGNQIGKGSGRKVATAIGLIGGAAFGAAAAGTQKMVPYSIVSFRDNQTGDVFEANLNGHWRAGMALRYSITDDGKLILR